jgi:broad specificity phosphatase PhoE
VEVDERLQPLHMGRGGGHDDAWDLRVAAWRKGRDEVLPGGESLADAVARAQELLQSLRGGDRGREVILVSHNEVISPLAATLRRRLLPRETARGVHNGSITVVDLPATGPPLVRLFAARP